MTGGVIKPTVKGVIVTCIVAEYSGTTCLMHRMHIMKLIVVTGSGSNTNLGQLLLNSVTYCS